MKPAKTYLVTHPHHIYTGEIGRIVEESIYLADPSLIILEFENRRREVFRASEVQALKDNPPITAPRIPHQTPANSPNREYFCFPCKHCGEMITVEKKIVKEKKTKLCSKHAASKFLRDQYAFRPGETLLKWLKREHPENFE